MSVRIKICGITRLADAETAVNAGADALGFMFYPPSPRNISLEQAATISRALPPFVARVGVFVNATEADIRQALDTVGLDALQLHGDEPPEFCRRFTQKIIKAFRIKDASSLEALPPYANETWLLDAFVAGQLGGTGARFNWDLARQALSIAAQGHRNKLILAGGLTPENAAEAVRQVQPYALDVSSGVEAEPGRKDPDKIRRFIAAARSAQ